MCLNLKSRYYKFKWLYKYKNNILNKDFDITQKDINEINGFDTNVFIFSIEYFDVIDNAKMNELIKKLYKLKKNDKDYNVDINYRKNNIIKINYIRPKFDSTGTGTIAKIELKNHKLFSKIDISWTQINNEEAVISYDCQLTKGICSHKTIHNYIKSNYKNLYYIDYLSYYSDLSFFQREVYKNIELENSYFKYLIQYELSKLFASNYLKKYCLPCKITYICEKKTRKITKYLKEPFLEESYKKDDNQYLIFNSLEDFEGLHINEFIFKKRFNSISMIYLFSNLKMILYYKLFYKIEKNELELRITKFLNSKKIWINIFDYKWLLNKYRRLKEKYFYVKEIEKVSISPFSKYSIELDNDQLVKNIQEVYKENIDFLNGINTLNYNIVVFFISVLALLVAILSFIFNL